MVKEKLHIICEKDVGLFSLIQQVISHIPLATSENRVPVVFFGEKCCYWTTNGYGGKKNVWEYYFEPIIPGLSVSVLSDQITEHIQVHPPHFEYPGYFIGNEVFVSNNFGNHRSLRKKALQIPFKWKDPHTNLRFKASEIIKKYVRPRSYIVKKVEQFYQENMSDHFMIGIHMRATDVTDENEHNIHRRGSYNYFEYEKRIHDLFKREPNARIFVATDSMNALEDLKRAFPYRIVYASSIFHTAANTVGKGPSGWVIPGYLSKNAEQAAKNGEEAVIDYLLLSKCNYLIHNGSGLARTVLLKEPCLAHINIHSKKRYLLNLFDLRKRRNIQVLKILISAYIAQFEKTH